MAATPPASADRRLAALFPDTAEGAPVLPWWRRRRGMVVIGIVVVGLIVSGFVAAGAFGSTSDSYRTATVTDHEVDAILAGVATIEPVAQATVAFPVSGTVASVNVQVGDEVAAGGTLASLDAGQLTETLHTQQAALAQAQLKLSKALAGQSVSGLGSSSTGGTGSSSNANLSAVRSVNTSRIVLTAATPDTQLQAAQQAVLTAQQQVDAALTAANTALTAEASVCAAFVASSASSASAPVTATADPPDATACQTAIQGVVTAQTAVNDAQKTLATASTALDTLLAQRAAQSPPATPPSTTPSSSPSTGTSGRTGGSSASGGTGGSTGSSFSGGGSSSPSAADLVSYQKAVDAAAAAVAVAQQGVAQATITSPLNGTVVAVNVHLGDSVTSSSSTANIVVKGSGGYEVSTTVNVDKIPTVSVGQTATVVPDGTHRSLSGKVVSISAMPDSSSTTTTVYRVVIALTDPNAKLDDGATGTASILTQHAKSAVAVPTSAITTTRNRHTVTVLDGGSPTVVPVKVGVLGGTWTEIKSGVTKGQQVVLADVSAALPDSATASTSSTQGSTRTGFGGFTGGGLIGGGNFPTNGIRNRG